MSRAFRRLRTDEVERGLAPPIRLSAVAGSTDEWRIEPFGGMRVPGVIFASAALLPQVSDEQVLRQVVNVATLPGIVEASYAMPDMHWGYGFPIGGVAATDVDHGGVVSPGGVGFDISCGVRMLVSAMSVDELRPNLSPLMAALDRTIPRGLAGHGLWRMADQRELDRVLQFGAEVAVAAGLGTEEDLVRCEDHGCIAGADPSAIGERAHQRGGHQVGSLGSGNHFLEIQVVDTILDEGSAESFGLFPSQICVMIHCGSRGLGHQICSDHVRVMRQAMRRFDIDVPDQQLACAPVNSPEGQAYLGAMAAAANYGRVNRQVLSDAVRRAFRQTTGDGNLTLLYDVSHNLAKLEGHRVEGRLRQLCVHRKGATRALPPGHPDLPDDLRSVGQPVLVPGSMGTASYVLVGVQPGGAFSSACHGAGRTLSRHASARQVSGEALRRSLEDAGISVVASSLRGLSEEAPIAYKDVDEVVATCDRVGLARPVARLRPVGVVKG